MSDGISESDLRDICDAIVAGRKIEAIKLYRKYTCSGLKEAKDAVEELENKLRQESPAEFAAAEKPESKQPTNSTVPGVQAGKGCFGLVAVILLVILAFFVVFVR